VPYFGKRLWYRPSEKEMDIECRMRKKREEKLEKRGKEVKLKRSKRKKKERRKKWP